MYRYEISCNRELHWEWTLFQFNEEKRKWESIDTCSQKFRCADDAFDDAKDAMHEYVRRISSYII